MSDSVAPAVTREDLQAIHDKFREIKHNINNTLAVVMALSELGQRNPAHYEKLAKAVLQRGPEVVQQLQDFQAVLGAKLKAMPAAAVEAGEVAHAEPAEEASEG